MRWTIVVVLSWLMLGGVTAAEHRGTLRGQLIGGDSKPVGDVAIRVESESTGAVRIARADAEGRFVVAELDAGSYRLTVDDDRYRAFAARTEVRVADTTAVTLDVAAGSASTTADFRPYFQHTDRASPAFRTRFEPPFLTTLPLDGRNIADLVALTPGLTTTPLGPVAAGSLSTSTAYLSDGVAAYDPLFGTPVLLPLPESVAEFAVMTPPLDARLGRSAGAQVNLVTRSGTNEFAGTAFGFYQSEAERLQAGGLVGGPLRRNSTFFFGDFGHARRDDLDDGTSGFNQASGRLDQLTGAGRLTARYALGRGGALDRSADVLGVTYVHQLTNTLTTDARFGFSRLAFADRWSSVLPEFDAIEAANVITWATASHLVTTGVEWYGFRPVDALLISDENTISAFVQDQWRASSRLSLTGGVRFDRLSLDPDEDGEAIEDESLIAPRAGFVYALGAGAGQVVRGDYGRHLQPDGSALDAWAVGVQHQWGRIRTLEVGYVGTRADDEWTGFGSDPQYNALRVQLQQRSETGLSAQVGYTFGSWTINSSDESERVRSSLDSRHKLTAAVTWRLPFGKDARWFTAGWLETIFGDMEVAGIAATQTGRPRIDRNAPQGPTWRRADVALIKTLHLGGSALELRAEMFNVSNRDNPRPPLLGTGFDALLAGDSQERRFQFGGRFRF
jgi:hypothetical protein